MTVSATIIADDDTEIRVSGEYSPACLGRRDMFGVPIEPDYEGDLDVFGIGTNDLDEEVELDAEQLQRARAALWEELGA
jgi:hypothetical protein